MRVWLCFHIIYLFVAYLGVETKSVNIAQLVFEKCKTIFTEPKRNVTFESCSKLPDPNSIEEPRKFVPFLNCGILDVFVYACEKNITDVNNYVLKSETNLQDENLCPFNESPFYHPELETAINVLNSKLKSIESCHSSCYLYNQKSRSECVVLSHVRKILNEKLSKEKVAEKVEPTVVPKEGREGEISESEVPSKTAKETAKEQPLHHHHRPKEGQQEPQHQPKQEVEEHQLQQQQQQEAQHQQQHRPLEEEEQQQPQQQQQQHRPIQQEEQAQQQQQKPLVVESTGQENNPPKPPHILKTTPNTPVEVKPDDEFAKPPKEESSTAKGAAKAQETQAEAIPSDANNFDLASQPQEEETPDKKVDLQAPNDSYPNNEQGAGDDDEEEDAEGLEPMEKRVETTPLKEAAIKDPSAVSKVSAGVDPDEFIPTEDSHFFIYFLMTVSIFIFAYVVFHNKNKVLAYALEGKRKKRRPNTANYRKLDSNLEEAISSNAAHEITSNIVY